MEERGAGELRYKAFLSYSHKDAATAARLHRRLETYRLPKRLVGSATGRGTVPERLWPIFRDRDELPAATDLSETVREALAQAGSLIILCSPHSAASLWVAEEIETFRTLYPDRPILAAIVEGDPPACFPAALRAFGQDGTWHEPLATDLRPEGDGPHLGLLKLVAGITGVGLDALVQRDASRRIRRVTTVTTGALVAMLVMAVLTLVALNARSEAERQRAEAEGLIEFMLTDLRERLRGVGRLDVMAAVNGRALAHYGAQEDLDRLPAESLERRARVLHAMGEDNMARGELDAAAAAFHQAHRTTRSLLDGSPTDPARIFAHAQSEFWVGRIPYARGDFAAARRAFERYKALADQLVALDPSNADWLKEGGFANGVLCTITLEQPIDAAAALRFCEASLEHMERVRQLGASDPAQNEDLANRHAWMVKAWHVNGRWDRALDHLRAHERFVESLLAADPNNLDYHELRIGAQIGFAEHLLERGDRAAARSRLADIAPDLADMRRHDPENAVWRSLDARLRRAMSQTAAIIRAANER